MQKIIKALRICANGSRYCPKDCPRHGYKREGCQERLMKDAANLLEQYSKSVDAVEFLKKQARMCAEFESCYNQDTQCPLIAIGLNCVGASPDTWSDRDCERMVEVVMNYEV